MTFLHFLNWNCIVFLKNEFHYIVQKNTNFIGIILGSFINVVLRIGVQPDLDFSRHINEKETSQKKTVACGKTRNA